MSYAQFSILRLRRLAPAAVTNLPVELRASRHLIILLILVLLLLLLLLLLLTSTTSIITSVTAPISTTIEKEKIRLKLRNIFYSD